MGDQIPWDETHLVRNGDFDEGYDWWRMDWSWSIVNGKAIYNYFLGNRIWTSPGYLSVNQTLYVVRFTIETLFNCRIRVLLHDYVSPWYTEPGNFGCICDPSASEETSLGFEVNPFSPDAVIIIDDIQLHNLAAWLAKVLNIYYQEHTLTDVVSEAADKATLRVCSLTDKSNCYIKTETG